MTWRQPRPSFPRRSVHHCVMRGSAPQATGGWRSTDWRFLPPRRVQTNPIAQRMVHRANRRSSAKKTAGSLPGSRSSLRVSRLEPTVWWRGFGVGGRRVGSEPCCPPAPYGRSGPTARQGFHPWTPATDGPVPDGHGCPSVTWRRRSVEEVAWMSVRR